MLVLELLHAYFMHVIRAAIKSTFHLNQNNYCYKIRSSGEI
jgi:hypothetical protein